MHGKGDDSDLLQLRSCRPKAREPTPRLSTMQSCSGVSHGGETLVAEMLGRMQGQLQHELRQIMDLQKAQQASEARTSRPVWAS